MTPVEALLAATAHPDYDIVRSAHAELLVTDLEAAERFYVDLLGLIVTAREEGALYLRGWEERLHHCLLLREAPAAAVGHLAFRVRSPADLDRIEASFAARGLSPRRVGGGPGQGPAVRVADELGYPLEFFHAMDPAPGRMQRFDLQRGAPVMRIDHFNLHVPEVERAAALWLGLGFRCTEYISTDGAGERLTGAWLARKQTVHDVALTAGRGPRLHHLGMWVAEPAGVLRACDQLAAAGHAAAIERGPGRHGVSNAFFVYLRDPDGHRIELYSCDYYTGDPDLEPIRWSVSDPRCRSFWGTRAPDSWYEESSPVIGPDGATLGTRECEVDERTEVMA
ncbi:MAG: 3,4-dihydroxyphenylacetate 2,3-dioxygenase [Solirubrobacterales bacterium]